MGEIREVNNFKRPKPAVLVVLDGWGVGPDSVGNAITRALTPNFDYFCSNFFCTTLQASGEGVGLPFGEMGNSEVGHLNLGAGKIVYQDLPRINKAIVEGEFLKNSIFLQATKKVLQNDSALHLMGLVSEGGVHASLDHLFALLELAKAQGVKKVFIHAILDGRDMSFNSGLKVLGKIEDKIKQLGVGQIVTVVGRYWAMDRDGRWQRTERAYLSMTEGVGSILSQDVFQSVEEMYEQKKYDEEMEPIVLAGSKDKPKGRVASGDSLIFFNFRADRARQLTKAFVLPGFEKFDRGQYLEDLEFVSMTKYEKDLPVQVAFPPEFVKTPLSKVLGELGLTQLHVAETEKYAHVTYFFNGGSEEQIAGEERLLVPSPKVESYDKKPEMSAVEIKKQVLSKVAGDKFDFILINFANADMVAHTGDLQASIKAIETVDECLGEIVEAVLAKEGFVVITADHGNAEKLIDNESGEIDKEHSTVPVPLLIVGAGFKKLETGDSIDMSGLSPSGVLADVAPTILKIMGLPKSEDMTGTSLV